MNKLKPLKIFKWLKKNSISDKEMLKTFNCGVSFLHYSKSKNFDKVKKYFSKNFEPYIIGKITSGQKRVNLNGKVNWS